MRHRHNWEHPTKDLFSRAGRQWLSAQPWPEVEALTVQQDLAQLALLESQLKATDQLIARLATQDSRVAQLMQFSGIGVFTAFTFLAIIGDIDRFPTASHLSGYVGLVPRQQQSGQRGYFGHITKSGSPLLRWLMVEAAQAAVRWDPHWREVHDRIATAVVPGLPLSRSPVSSWSSCGICSPPTLTINTCATNPMSPNFRIGLIPLVDSIYLPLPPKLLSPIFCPIWSCLPLQIKSFLRKNQGGYLFQRLPLDTL